VGFQQAPDPAKHIPGYADALHENLAQFLDASLLGDDPQRKRSRRGEAGPVYVQSDWPPDSLNSEAGLARLGTWVNDRSFAVNSTGMELVGGDESIAHVALVYSHLVGQGPHLGPAAEIAAKATISLSRYTSFLGAARALMGDISGLMVHQKRVEKPVGPARSGLRVRVEAVPSSRHSPALENGSTLKPVATQPTEGLKTVIGRLEADVATYVSHNSFRSRIRGFVREALLRIIFREDVAGVVINAHSQGTVLAFDVLRELPPFAASKVRFLVTAGSPLRKYTSLFTWGHEVGSIRTTTPWTNYFDPRDPVADPLAPFKHLQERNARQKASDRATLYEWVDPASGSSTPVLITDQQVDNVHNTTGSGMRAHNYWDNVPQFVQPLAETLRSIATAAEPSVQNVDRGSEARTPAS
jgi:hypothetical protein